MKRSVILTISDSAHKGTRDDTSGPEVGIRLFEFGFSATVFIVPDEQAEIEAKLRECADSGEFDIVFTTGGTGIAARDVTPEATRAVIDFEIPGIGEAMRRAGQLKVKTAILSRALAGVRGRTLIVNLPGSPKGAIQSLESIIGVIPHALDLLAGKTEH